MKKIPIAICLACLTSTSFADAILSPAQEAVVNICTNTTKESWEGKFTFPDVHNIRTLHIQGQRSLHIVPYRLGNHTVIDAFSVDKDLKVTTLYEGQPTKKGDTPVLESIVVLPAAKQSDIIIRWRYPGQGALLMIQSFLWDGRTLKLSTLSTYGGHHDPIWRRQAKEHS